MNEGFHRITATEDLLTIRKERNAREYGKNRNRALQLLMREYCVRMIHTSVWYATGMIRQQATGKGRRMTKE